MVPYCRMLGSDGYTKESRTRERTTEGSGRRGYAAERYAAKSRQGNRVRAWDHRREDRHCHASEEEDREACEEEQNASATQGEETGQEDGG
jgi:hypothetical protein